MNGLTSTATLGSWREQKSLRIFVYEIIDSKIDFIELKTRHLLDKFRRKEPDVIISHRSEENYTLPTLTGLHVNKAETEQIFEHLEKLSRSLSILEQMKFSLREENAFSVMVLLDDDKYMKFDNTQIEQELGVISRTL